MRWLLIICLFVCYFDQQTTINRLEEDYRSIQRDINNCQYNIDMLDSRESWLEGREELKPITENLNND